MTKFTINSIKKSKKKVISLQQIKDHLQDNHECYVLITCSKPTIEGKMDVELNYSGDESLASYLIDGAQNTFVCDEKAEQMT